MRSLGRVPRLARVAGLACAAGLLAGSAATVSAAVPAAAPEEAPGEAPVAARDPGPRPAPKTTPGAGPRTDLRPSRPGRDAFWWHRHPSCVVPAGEASRGRDGAAPRLPEPDPCAGARPPVHSCVVPVDGLSLDWMEQCPAPRDERPGPEWPLPAVPAPAGR